MSSSSEIIALLRRLGAQVYVRHLRWMYDVHLQIWSLQPKYMHDPLSEMISPKGGETHVVILWKGTPYKGSALCSKSDTFHRKFGLRLALMRAIASLPTPPTVKPGRAIQNDGAPYNGGVSSPADGIAPPDWQKVG